MAGRPFLGLDVRYVKQRQARRTVSVTTGQRDILGVSVASDEMESCWKTCLENLVAQEPSGVPRVLSDARHRLAKPGPPGKCCLSPFSWTWPPPKCCPSPFP